MNLAERIAARQKAALEMEAQKRKAEEARKRAKDERKRAEPIPFETIVESIEACFEKYPKLKCATIKVPSYRDGWMPTDYTHVGEIPMWWAKPLGELLESYGFNIKLDKSRANCWILAVNIP